MQDQDLHTEMPLQPAINDVFEHVIVVNLDRRPDRLASVTAQLQHLGVSFERFAAIDGQAPAVTAEWLAYAQGEPIRLPDGVRPVETWREFYLDYDSDLARTAFFEAQRGKAIATAGAWGLLRSMSAILERAVVEGWHSLLVLEDDVLFHQDTLELFGRFMVQVPDDWQVLQLGAMQLHWDSDWISWHSQNLYQCHGSSIGAHAFGLRAEVMPELLECSRGCDLPFDIGALHTIKRRHAARCFTMFPNLAIQDAADSEIGMSTMFFREARQVDNIYRWYLPHYGLGALERGAAARAVPPAADELPSPGPEARSGEHRRPWLERIRQYARTRAGRRQVNGRRGSDAPAGSDAHDAAPRPDGTGPAPRKHLGGQPPLRARGKKAKAHAIIAVVAGLDRAMLIGVLDLLRAQCDRGDVEPVLLTDCEAFELFRERQLVFEYLPPPELRQRLAPGLDWNLYTMRRLALLRRKWQPVRIVSFGPRAAELVALWKESLFEDESIHRVAAGAATIDHSDPAVP